MKKFITVINVLLVLLLFSSCVSNRKINQLNQSIKGQKQMETKLDSLMTLLNNVRKEKNTMGELDDTSSTGIKKIIDKESAESRVRIQNLESMETQLSKKRVKVKEYKNLVTIVSSGAEIQSEKMTVVEFVDQLLKQQTFMKFNLAAFFPPGGYKIAPEKLTEAKTVFEPLIDSLFGFVQRFPKFNLVSSVVSCGYADGQGFSPGDLVNTLTANLGKPTATKEELNLELSRLRSEEIAGVLMEICKEKIKKQQAAATVNTRFFITGKGEEFPNKKITDYQTDDERRRIVVIYWNALPETK